MCCAACAVLPVPRCVCCAVQYEEIGEEVVGKLDGMFAFVLLNEKDGSYIACRDAIGICPLYIGWGRDGAHFPFAQNPKPRALNHGLGQGPYALNRSQNPPSLGENNLLQFYI